MTNHIDPKQIAKAKEWAETVNHYDDTYNREELTIAGLIASLPDQIIDADAVREWMDNFIQEGRTGTPHEWLADAFTELQNKFLTPPLPTLDDLIERGHDPAQYQWMQADFYKEGRICITNTEGSGLTWMKPDGSTFWSAHTEFLHITPLPDLPRLVWPAQEQEPSEDSSTPEAAPKVLTTVRDYEQAAKGTVVFGDAVREKSSDGLWYMPGWEPGRTSKQMRDLPRKIIYMPEVQV